MPAPPLPALDRGLIDRARRLLAPWRALTRPRFFGLEHVPTEGPVLLVGNHTLYGVFDVPLMWDALIAERGRLLRGMGDHVHFRLPGWSRLAAQMGVVDGTRENASALLEAGEAILVFPGGAREVFKARRDRYRLLWGRRTGFARLALRHRAPIVPFAALGVEHGFDVVLDKDDVARTAVGRIMTTLGMREDLVPPLARGWRGLPVPRPERLYFKFGAPILSDDDETDESARALQQKVRAEVEQLLAALEEIRAADPGRGPVRVRDAAFRALLETGQRR